MNLDPQLPGRRAGTAVKLVGKLPVEPDLELPASCDMDERRPLGLAQHDSAQRPGPLRRVPGGDHSEFQQPVIWVGLMERLDSAEDLAHVPGQDTRDPALEEALAVDLDDCLHPACAEVPGPGVEV